MHWYNVYFVYMLRAQVIYYLQALDVGFVYYMYFLHSTINIIMLKINT